MIKRTLAGTLLATAALGALAGGHAYGPFPPAYANECGGCHVAYPPALLTASGWRAVMSGLDKHYGVDAGLAEKPRAAIADFVESNASRRDKHAATTQQPRLTQTAWFRKEHRGLPDKATATLPAAAQCESCHTAAERGDYGEASLRLPGEYRSIRRKEH